MAKGKAQKQYLSPAEVETLKDQKRELETTLKDAEVYGKGTPASQIDLNVIKQEIAHLDRVLAESEPKTPRGVEKDKLHKEEQELEVKIAEGMPTRYEMDKPSKNPGAVRKHLVWLKRNNDNIEQYRQIQRLLRPFDPKSIESLRKEK